MGGWLGKVAKGLLIGAGTVLSCIPTIGPAVGAPLIAAGVGIDTNNTTDRVSAASQSLTYTLNPYTGQASIGQASITSFQGIINWLTTNPFVLLALIGGVLYFIFGRKRRR